jgi:ubiquinone/menaquinone biosynthesis C-methylase UbiE
MARDRSVKYHNRVAKKYDAIYDDVYWDFHDEITWHRVKPYLPRDANAKCLDLGCGTGKWGLKLLKSGFHTTFVDHSPAMVGEVRGKLDELGKTSKAEGIVGDIISMPMLADSSYSLTLAMGDPLSICSDPQKAAREMSRITVPGGIVIATADNKLAAIDHYLERGDLDALETFMRTGKTRWLTNDREEQFELTTFTPSTLRKLLEKFGFDVIEVSGKTILPIRTYKELASDPAVFRRLIKIEEELNDDQGAASRASHLQIIAKKRITAAPDPK